MMARLGDVFTLIRNGASIKQTDGSSGIPITRIETISNRVFDRNKLGYADIQNPAKYQDYILQDKDILMSHINSEKHLGKTVLFHQLPGEVIIHGMNLLILRADTKILMPEYAAYYFNSSAFSRQVSRVVKKSVNQASFTVTALKDLTIPIVPMMTQIEVVSTLDIISSFLASRKQQLSKLDELIKARFVEMFGDPVLNPYRWKIKRFEEICENLDSQRIPIASNDRANGPYPYYGASGIVDYVSSYIFDEDLLLVSEDGANLILRSTPIAFSVSGKVWVNNHAHVLRFSSKALQKYIEIYFSLIDISDNVTGTAQPKLNQANLNRMLFCIPPISLQHQFSAFVTHVEESKAAVQRSLDKAQQLFDSLMQKYFG